MTKRLITALLFFMFSNVCCANAQQSAFNKAIFKDEDALNLFCLRLAYPSITGMTLDSSGKSWITLNNGARLLYNDPDEPDNQYSLNSTIRTSMDQIYPLEPDRPPSRPNFAPGRHRPYNLFHALYGNSPDAVKKNLQNINLGKNMINLTTPAAEALRRALPKLEKMAQNSSMKKYLKLEGGYYWRKIAGEKDLSAHSFGIAIDMGVDSSPYWRWSKQMPHPLQADYPSEIVRTMEEQGFIWGGKWREYDLMHFEYRPELICKSRLSRWLR